MHITLFALFFSISIAQACSRVAYDSGPEDGSRIVIGRTMDWLEPTNSSIYLLPAGMSRNGAAGPSSLTWTSKYGSVITSMYDIGSVDGMNSEGLVGNLLYLAGGDFGIPDAARQGLSIALWQQYFLDNFATVAEAVEALHDSTGTEVFQVRTKSIVPGVPTDCHLALTDPGGDNVVLEYVNGKLHFYHSSNYSVMTNEPPYDEQLALDAYWAANPGGALPGTALPADRFARLAYYRRHTMGSKDAMQAVATVAGMVRAVSVPRLPSSIEEPNNSETLWRTYADTREKRYFFDSAEKPMLIWVELGRLDLSTKGEVMRLGLDGPWDDMMAGDVTDRFVKAGMFEALDVGDVFQKMGSSIHGDL